SDFMMGDVIKAIYLEPLSSADKFTFTTPQAVDSTDFDIPTNYQLFQNYPNPFNPLTTIRFSLPESGLVKLNVYNILGERVEQLLNTELSAGKHEIIFNRRNLASGVYIYTLDVQDKFFEAKKMLLLK
ncbi:MAG: T9SS type A sorting domain-containing protein, partial [Ignavibacteriaceae bacterium]|nr:T9SS type A sorting domain-containing protein [Ignavibacteriaceae bacterium]